jgi:hypothetical protein
VSPPPTGSYSAPNTYMGSPVPAGTVAPGQISPMPQGPYPTQSNNGVGSGAQPGGWTTSNPATGQPAPNPAGVATVSTFGVATSDPRSGGMQVIDMTSAPAPPGYQPAGTGTNISVPPPQGPAAYAPPANPTQVYPTPSYPAPTYPTNVAPATTYPPSNGQNVSAPYPTDPSAEIASRLTPIPTGMSAVPMAPVTVQSFGTQPPGTVSGPSTEPVNSGTIQTDSNLMWRAPGTQY